MKKLVGIAFVGMMVVGCGGGAKSTPDTTTPAAGQAPADPNATPPPAADPAAAPPAGQAAPQ